MLDTADQTLQRANALRLWRIGMSRLGWPRDAHETTRARALAACPPPGYADAIHARDIPDERFLAVVNVLNTDEYWATRWDVQDALGAPEKVVLAKARRLIQRGVMEGCYCGCRGDFVVTSAAR